MWIYLCYWFNIIPLCFRIITSKGIIYTLYICNTLLIVIFFGLAYGLYWWMAQVFWKRWVLRNIFLKSLELSIVKMSIKSSFDSFVQVLYISVIFLISALSIIGIVWNFWLCLGICPFLLPVLSVFLQKIFIRV